MHSIVTTFRGADIKVEVANFCAAMDTLIDQDALTPSQPQPPKNPVFTCTWPGKFQRVLTMDCDT